MSKKIEVVTLKVSELKNGFGNPRKIKGKNAKVLKDSLESLGDFGVIVIDEKLNIICGSQRVTQMRQINPDTEVLCKKLIGYTENELKTINIRGNTHAGEWDLNLLSEWTADLNLDIKIPKLFDPEDRKLETMELIRFEKYDFVLIACKTDIDYNLLCTKLGILEKKTMMSSQHSIKARAIWFDKIMNKLK